MLTYSFLTNRNGKEGSLNFKAFKVKKTDANHYSLYDARNEKREPFHHQGKDGFVSSTPEF